MSKLLANIRRLAGSRTSRRIQEAYQLLAAGKAVRFIAVRADWSRHRTGCAEAALGAYDRAREQGLEEHTAALAAVRAACRFITEHP